MKMISSKWLRPAGSRIVIIFLLLFCVIGSGIVSPRTMVFAASVEVLTPRPGGTVFARNPQTHLVLRQTGAGKANRVKVEKSGEILAPVVSMEGDDATFLHFRLPLKPGKNSFIIIPDGQRLEFNFHPIQSQLYQKSFGKDSYFFHQIAKLPEICQDCHDLKETETIEPVGLKKQISCGICHKTIVDKGSWKHGPTVNQQCLACHQQSVKPWRIGFPKARIDDICLTCHVGKKKWFSRKYLHGPMIGGCTLCHDPHGSDNQYQLWANGSLNICISCHTDKANLVSKKKKERPAHVHGIIVGQGCVACHNPHGADYRFMLTKPINQLCTGCHTFLLGVKRGHPVANHPLSAPKDPRRPDRKLVCTGCHDPHGSSHQFMLFETKAGALLCRECHRR